MKVSVVTVCFNSEKHIQDCIESVNNQKYKDIEHIFIDGGSSDNTLNIIDKKSSKCKKVISEGDKGIYDAMNKGVTISSGEVVCFLNSDDKYADEEVISDVVNCFTTAQTPVQLVHGGIRYFGDGKKHLLSRVWQAKEISEMDLKKGFIPPHPATFIKKSVLPLPNAFNLDYDIAADFDLIKRILIDQNYEQRILSRILVDMRYGGLSTSGYQALIKQNKEIYNSIKISFPELRFFSFFASKIICKAKQYKLK